MCLVFYYFPSLFGRGLVFINPDALACVKAVGEEKAEDVASAIKDTDLFARRM